MPRHLSPRSLLSSPRRACRDIGAVAIVVVVVVVVVIIAVAVATSSSVDAMTLTSPKGVFFDTGHKLGIALSQTCVTSLAASAASSPPPLALRAAWNPIDGCAMWLSSTTAHSFYGGVCPLSGSSETDAASRDAALDAVTSAVVNASLTAETTPSMAAMPPLVSMFRLPMLTAAARNIVFRRRAPYAMASCFLYHAFGEEKASTSMKRVDWAAKCTRITSLGDGVCRRLFAPFVSSSSSYFELLTSSNASLAARLLGCSFVYNTLSLLKSRNDSQEGVEYVDKNVLLDTDDITSGFVSHADRRHLVRATGHVYAAAILGSFVKVKETTSGVPTTQRQQQQQQQQQQEVRARSNGSSADHGDDVDLTQVNGEGVNIDEFDSEARACLSLVFDNSMQARAKHHTTRSTSPHACVMRYMRRRRRFFEATPGFDAARAWTHPGEVPSFADEHRPLPRALAVVGPVASSSSLRRLRRRLRAILRFNALESFESFLDQQFVDVEAVLRAVPSSTPTPSSLSSSASSTSTPLLLTMIDDHFRSSGAASAVGVHKLSDVTAAVDVFAVAGLSSDMDASFLRLQRVLIDAGYEVPAWLLFDDDVADDVDVVVEGDAAAEDATMREHHRRRVVEVAAKRLRSSTSSASIEAFVRARSSASAVCARLRRVPACGFLFTPLTFARDVGDDSGDDVTRCFAFVAARAERRAEQRWQQRVEGYGNGVGDVDDDASASGDNGDVEHLLDADDDAVAAACASPLARSASFAVDGMGALATRSCGIARVQYSQKQHRRDRIIGDTTAGWLAIAAGVDVHVRRDVEALATRRGALDDVRVVVNESTSSSASSLVLLASDCSSSTYSVFIRRNVNGDRWIKRPIIVEWSEKRLINRVIVPLPLKIGENDDDTTLRAHLMDTFVSGTLEAFRQPDEPTTTMTTKTAMMLKCVDDVSSIVNGIKPFLQESNADGESPALVIDARPSAVDACDWPIVSMAW